MLSLKGNLSARDPKLLFHGSGGEETSSGGRREGSQKEVKNEVKADASGSGVWGRGDLSNAVPHRAEHAYGDRDGRRSDIF